MGDLPETLSRDRNVDLPSHPLRLSPRALGVVVFTVFVLAGLVNVFGQKTSTSRATGAGADLLVETPDAARSGLIYESQFTIRAHRLLERPELVLDPGWFDGLTVNTIDPEPSEWSQRDGRNVLVFGRTAAGSELTVRLQYQVNPTTAGRRDQSVTLADAGVPVVVLDHELTVFP